MKFLSSEEKRSLFSRKELCLERGEISLSLVKGEKGSSLSRVLKKINSSAARGDFFSEKKKFFL